MLLAFSGSAIAAAEVSPPKMEDLSSVNRATFPSAHANGIDKSTLDGDIKYAQVKHKTVWVYYVSDRPQTCCDEKGSRGFCSIIEVIHQET